MTQIANPEQQPGSSTVTRLQLQIHTQCLGSNKVA